MRPVVDAVWMQRQHPGCNVVAAEKVAGVIKQHFIVINVAVVEGDTLGAGCFFQRTWHKRAHHKSFTHQRYVNARR
jgi:hypothetical protein